MKLDPFWSRSKRVLRGFAPVLTPPPLRECLRTALGASAGLLVCLSLWLWGVNEPRVLLFTGPLAASAVLLFAVHSGVLSQPWSVLGSYLVAAVVTITLTHVFGHQLPVLCAALLLSLLLMFLLRCLHPPGGAVALSLAAMADADMGGVSILWPLMGGVATLVALAMLYHRLTGAQYPKLPEVAQQRHGTADESARERVGINQDDLDRAVRELGVLVDITPADLTRVLRLAERFQLQRHAGRLTAADIMAKDVRTVTPQTRRDQALKYMRRARLNSLPVVNEHQQLVGIISLIDLVRRPKVAIAQRLGLSGWVRVQHLMTTAVQTVTPDAGVAELTDLLTEGGYHGLPVVEGRTVVGMITQTDLVAALGRELSATSLDAASA